MPHIFDDMAVAGPAPAGKAVAFYEPKYRHIAYKDDTGRSYHLGGQIRNWSTGTQDANAADTYLIGSQLPIPIDLRLQIGTTFHWTMAITKTAAGVATPIWRIRFGTAGAIGDAAAQTFTQVAAQTAAVDAAVVDIEAVVHSLGAGGRGSAWIRMNHVLAATGFSTLTTNVQTASNSQFDSTIDGAIAGLSVDPGAAGVWTINCISAEVRNI